MPERLVTLIPGRRDVRAAMKEAHDMGRHGDGSQLDVLRYWAGCCVDCNAQHYYEHVACLVPPSTAE